MQTERIKYTKSVKTNVILNVIRQAVNMLAPLVTVPYVSRVLGSEVYGMVSFSRTYITYFILLASLGVANYAVREGAKLHSNREALNKFTSEIFSINVYMTLLSYLILAASLLIPQLQPYRILISVFSLEILLNTLGVEWVCSVYEDYVFFTVRTVVVRIITIISTFVFVKSESDYYLYAGIIVISYAFTNIANLMHSRRYVDLRLTTNINLKTHITPIMVLFGNTVMATLYISSDNTILGLMSTDASVGLYTLATQAYSIVKTVTNAMTIVTLARLSYYINNGEKDKYNRLLEKTIKSILFIILPAAVGLIFTSRESIYLLGGLEYMEASGCLKILSTALAFAVVNSLLTVDVLIPFGKEKEVFIYSVISAGVNIIFNIILIPFFDFYAAGVTTLLSEALVFALSLNCSKKLISIKINREYVVHLLVGILIVVLVCCGVDLLELKYTLSFILKIIASVLVYALIMVILNNEVVNYYRSYVSSLIGRLRLRGKD